MFFEQHVYANQFLKFSSLSFLHLQLHNPQPAFHPPAINSPTATTTPVVYHPYGTQYYPYHQQPPQPQLLQQQQPSYQPFPPRAPPLASSSSGSGSGGGPGTPKRRSGPKRDGGEHDESEDSTIVGSGGGSTSGGETSSSVIPPQSSHRMPPPIHHTAVPSHHPHAPIPPNAYHPAFPHPQQQQTQAPYIPPQPLGTLESAKHVANAVKSLDFVGWNGELYVIVRTGSQTAVAGVETNGETGNSGKAEVGGAPDGAEERGGPQGPRVSLSPSIATTNNVSGGGSAVGEMSSTTPAPSTPAPASVAPPAQQQQQPPASSTVSTSTSPSSSSSSSSSTTAQNPGPSHPQAPTPTPMTTTTQMMMTVELKELPSRRRLDCGKGVDLGGEDAVWLERKDVPMDYDMPVGAAVEG